MGREIERRFLVRASLLPSLTPGVRIVQGYLSGSAPSVRVRLAWPDWGGSIVRSLAQRGYLTVKGPGSVERDEYEYRVPARDAREMVSRLCVHSLEKVRHRLPAHPSRLSWSVDFFQGPLSPLIMAEVELPDRGFRFHTPEWLGPEVTNDPAYSNGALAAAGVVPPSWASLMK